MKPLLRRTRFSAVRTRAVDSSRVVLPDPNDWREQQFKTREAVRLAARSEAEAVDNQLRSGLTVVGGAERETVSIEATREGTWQRLKRTIGGMIPAWRSRTKI